jgi:hypothetical protein
MKLTFKKLSGWLPVVVILAGLLALAGPAVTRVQVAQADSDDIKTLPVPPAYTAEWWQWAYSIPPDQNPLLDETGKFCDQGQKGKRWFLAGVLNESGKATRKCTIPYGKQLFFPILNVEQSAIEVRNGDAFLCEDLGESKADLRECANRIADLVAPGSLTLTIKNLGNGNVTDLSDKISRVESPPFKIHLPDPNLLGYTGERLDPNPSDAASDGYWVALKPLSPGKYELEFSGSFEVEGEVVFTLIITYNLTIENK